MKLSLDDAYLIAEDTIVNNLRHAHYKHVTDLAKLYKQLITGKDTDDLFRQFTRREDDVMFGQRKALSQLITPAVSASVKMPFYKAGRVNNIIKKIEIKQSEDDKENNEKINEAIKSYNGKRSLDKYMQTRFTNLSFTDPNSFIITEFDAVPVGPNGEMLEPVKPRPFIATSKTAVNYMYDNGILQWIIVELPVKYKTKTGDKKEGSSYTMYFPNYALKYTQVDSENYSINPGEYAVFNDGVSEFEVFRADKERTFRVDEFEHKSEIIPAIRVGYKEDEVTDGDTCVSPMHDALPYFMKSIKTVSEFDLTMCLHAFPHKFQYVNKCLGSSPEIGCDSGKTIEGNTCSKCKGTGIAIHTSAQDAVVMRLPRDKDEMLNLEQMIHYEYPPIELLRFQNEYIQQLKTEVRDAVFPSKDVSRATVTKTATEMDYAYDDVYDTLFPFAEHFSEVYKHIVLTASYYLDLKDLTVIHQFPKDFKFKSVADLLGELKLSNDSDAPGYVRRELTNDIAENQFIDKPSELSKIKTKERFFPFPDKTETEIVYIISNNKTTQFNEILWANFDYFFSGLEQDAKDKQEDFYSYAYSKQNQLLKLKVDTMIAEIQASAPEVSVGFGNDDAA